MGKKCLFCGDKNLSKEHIIPQWLLRELNIYEDQLIMVHNYMGIDLSERQFVFNKLVNTLVCTTCNNGWMSKLEDELKEYLISMINMDDKCQDSIRYLVSNSFEFSKWFFKTAILLNYPTNYRKIVPSSHFKRLYDGKIPNGVFVDIGITKNEDVINWRQSQGGLMYFNSNKYSKEEIMKKQQERYKITFQFKHLLFSITYMPFKYDELSNSCTGAICLYPNVGIYEEVKIFNDIDEFDLNGIIQVK